MCIIDVEVQLDVELNVANIYLNVIKDQAINVVEGQKQCREAINKDLKFYLSRQ